MKGGLVFLKVVRRMLRRFTSSPTQHGLNNAVDEDDETAVPVDVKEGHFVVCTVDGSRSVVELSYLTHPGFMKLLELAEKEFGFEQMGILVIPCTYNQLQSVIATK